MLTVQLADCRGETMLLPVLLSWDMTLTGSVPCDCFSCTCIYNKEMAEFLPGAIRFTVYRGDELMLRGVVDAYRISLSREGITAEVEGRGMAALLLDNESEAMNYGYASLEDILEHHVRPYSLPVSTVVTPRAIPYAVSFGSSQWKALHGYVHRAEGFAPYFTREGVLVIGPLWGSGKTLEISDASPILSLEKRERRYGVISEVLIQDKMHWVRQQVVNAPFAASGGSRRHVLYMPSSTDDQRRYTGEYQIQQSALDQENIRLELPMPFAAFPGDRVALNHVRLGLRGSYDVVSSRSRMDQDGMRTELLLSVR